MAVTQIPQAAHEEGKEDVSKVAGDVGVGEEVLEDGGHGAVGEHLRRGQRQSERMAGAHSQPHEAHTPARRGRASRW